VYDVLTADGYTVGVVQNATVSLEDDVATTHRVIEGLPGPVTVVGHSYGGAVSQPAWRAKPTWYLVAGDDRMIPPPAQRAMAERIGATTVEVPGSSHSVYVSRPAAVADLIKQAAQAQA
jgi:pimeloyl-ACP methyl ester carboxylesterase